MSPAGGGPGAPIPRVTQVIQHYPPYLGGAERQAQAVARELAARAGSARVVTCRYAPSAPPREREGGVEIHRLPTLPRGTRPANLLSGLCWALVAARRSDLVHAHCVSPLSLGVLCGAWLRGVPTALKVSTPSEIARVEAVPGAALLRWIAGRAAVLTVSSEEMRRRLVEAGWPPDRVRVLPNLLLHRPRPRERGARPVLLFVGRLVAAKGILLLREAWPRIAREHDALLRIVGDGPERAAVEALVRASGGSVEYLGYQPDPGPAFAGADILLFPSEAEAYGNVVAEAMAQGLAIVATRTGLAAGLRHEEEALLVERSVDAFVTASLRLLREPALAARLGAAAARLAEAELAAEGRFEAWAELYRELARAPAPRRPRPVHPRPEPRDA